MAIAGKNPNGLNQLSSSLVSLFVSGSDIVSFTSESVNFVGKITASAVETYEIGTKGDARLNIKDTTQLTGSLYISENASASLFEGSFKGDGSQLSNIPASSIGDIDRLKSGSI